MSKIVDLSTESLKSLSNKMADNWVIPGLAKGQIGFIISSPEVGKGYLCLSLAYELALQTPLVGISSQNDNYKKTLYWPIEDGLEIAASRIIKHYEGISEDSVAQIKSCVSLWRENEPICDPRGNVDADKAFKELTEAAKGYDLLIIDTLREAVGTSDEVDDDLFVKSRMQKLAKDADVALLLVHHLTKNAARGLEKVSNVSGSGFSRTLANSRLQFHLEKKDKSSKNKEGTYLSHIKANNLDPSSRIFERYLSWNDQNMIYFAGYKSLIASQHNSSGLKAESKKSKLSQKRTVVEEEPLEICLDNFVFSEESNRLALEASNAEMVHDDEEEKAYAEFLLKNEKRSPDQK